MTIIEHQEHDSNDTITKIQLQEYTDKNTMKNAIIRMQ